MRLPFHRSGGAGWLIVAGVVVAWDMVAPETMSSAFRRATATPRGRVAVAAAWGLLTAHLFETIPRRHDPLQLAVGAVRRRKEVPCGVLLHGLRNVPGPGQVHGQVQGVHRGVDVAPASR